MILISTSINNDNMRRNKKLELQRIKEGFKSVPICSNNLPKAIIKSKPKSWIEQQNEIKPNPRVAPSREREKKAGEEKK